MLIAPVWGQVPGKNSEPETPMSQIRLAFAGEPEMASPIPAKLDDEALKRIGAKARFQANETIFNAGDVADSSSMSQ